MTLQCPTCERDYAEGTHCPADGSALLEATTERASAPKLEAPFNEVIDGRFRILEQIGAGGMGTVHRGEQINVQREVAIKLLHERVADEPQVLARFKREARIVSLLRHPNTLKLIDFGERADGTGYIVTEFLRGEPLDAVLTSGPLDEARTLRLMREICLSLEEAHGHGIVHRDLKPQNVFIDRVGDQEIVKVLDFGVAKVSNEVSAIAETEALETRAGFIIGTPAYMSPEQASALPLDGRSDLYSLGALAYRCIAGKPPFTGQSTQILVAHVCQPPVALSACSGVTISAAFDALISQLLAKQPEDRPASAAAVREMIDAIAAPTVTGRSAPPASFEPAFADEATRAPAPAASAPPAELDETTGPPPRPQAPTKAGRRLYIGLAAAAVAAAVAAGIATLDTARQATATPSVNGEPTPVPPSGFLDIPDNDGPIRR